MIMMVLKIIYSNLTNLIFISYTKTYLIYIYINDLTVIRNDFNYIPYIVRALAEIILWQIYLFLLPCLSHILCE